MKSLLTLLISLALSTFTTAQNGIYLYGFMENAPTTPVFVDVLVYSDSTVSWTMLVTDAFGNFETQFVELPEGAQFQGLETSFIDCNGSYVNNYLGASDFPNTFDIPIFLFYCVDSVAYGCTDPTATNYDPQAQIDNGSCIYPSNCELNEVVINMSTALWGYEISWVLTTDNMVMAAGSGYGNNSNYSSEYCLPDGCYTLQMIDSYGDGWNGGALEILIDGILFNSFTLQAGSFSTQTFGINQDSCQITIAGCTDPEAVNYNPVATTDDGSCTYSPFTPNDLCSDATPILPGITFVDNTQAWINEGIWGECWGFGAGEGEQTSVWYTFTTPAMPASIHFEALYDGTNTLTDTQFGIFETCGGEMIYCDGNSGIGLMSALDFACGELEENATYILMIDGWNGDAGTCLLSYQVDTLCTGTVPGCTDPEAINYNPLATADDGSCIYTSNCELNEVTVIINTEAWGSEIGWYILGADSAAEVASGSGYGNNGSYTSTWCLADGCYFFDMTDSYGDGWNGGTYEVWINGVNLILSGTLQWGYYGSMSFGINTTGCESVLPVYGCTDPEALNYNPAANTDDGTCEYSTDCTDVAIVLDGNGSLDALWVVWSNAGYFQAGMYDGGTTTVNLCLPDDCYFLFLEGAPADSSNSFYYNIFIDNDVVAAGLFDGFTQISFETGAGCDSTNVVWGCTDPQAINYNPLANADDGSCTYQFECGIDFLVIPDSTGANVIWIIPSANIFNATSVLWDFGDGTTSTELFPQHAYTGDGPYTLCLTAFFETANGGTCSITYCVVLTGDMVGGPGFAGSSGFNINVINAQGPLGTSTPEGLSGLVLWPNPTRDVLNIGNLSAEITELDLAITDITGKVVFEQHIGQINQGADLRMDLNMLSNGMYLLRINASGQVHTERFVIAR
jgi:hypothetical protein